MFILIMDYYIDEIEDSFLKHYSHTTIQHHAFYYLQ